MITNVLTKVMVEENVTIRRGDLITTQHGERIIATSKDRQIAVTLDREFNLKSRVRENLKDLLDGYKIENVQPVSYEFFLGTAENDLDNIKVGDAILVESKEGNVYRIVCGGHSYGVDKYFTVDPETFIIKSNMYDSLEDLLERYNIHGVFEVMVMEEAEEEITIGCDGDCGSCSL